jgi:hypothetical protein
LEAPASTDEQLQASLRRIITRLMILLTRRAVLVEEEATYLADYESDLDEARRLGPLRSSAYTHRIAFGPRRAQGVHLARRHAARRRV